MCRVTADLQCPQFQPSSREDCLGRESIPTVSMQFEIPELAIFNRKLRNEFAGYCSALFNLTYGDSTPSTTIFPPFTLIGANLRFPRLRGDPALISIDMNSGEVPRVKSVLQNPSNLVLQLKKKKPRLYFVMGVSLWKSRSSIFLPLYTYSYSFIPYFSGIKIRLSFILSNLVSCTKITRFCQ